MLVRCLYASRSVQHAPPAVLDRILAQSRTNNLRRGITGLLCATPELFVQVLEGGRDEVSALLCNIMRDDRHVDVRLLSYEEIGERRFANWSMGLVDLASVNPALLLKYSTRPALDPFAATGQATMALLTELVASGAIVNRAMPHRDGA